MCQCVLTHAQPSINQSLRNCFPNSVCHNRASILFIYIERRFSYRASISSLDSLIQPRYRASILFIFLCMHELPCHWYGHMLGAMPRGLSPAKPSFGPGEGDREGSDKRQTLNPPLPCRPQGHTEGVRRRLPQTKVVGRRSYGFLRRRLPRHLQPQAALLSRRLG